MDKKKLELIPWLNGAEPWKLGAIAQTEDVWVRGRYVCLGSRFVYSRTYKYDSPVLPVVDACYEHLRENLESPIVVQNPNGYVRYVSIEHSHTADSTELTVRLIDNCIEVI